MNDDDDDHRPHAMMNLPHTTEYKHMISPDLDESPDTKQSIMTSTWFIFLNAVLGFGLGYVLSNDRASIEVIHWIALPGELFLRALKCIVLPLVFINIILAMVDMLQVGQASSIGWRTCGLYFFTTLVAALEGLVAVLIFQPWFRRPVALEAATGLATSLTTKGIQLGCGGGGALDKVVHAFANGTLACVKQASLGSISLSMLYEIKEEPSDLAEISFSQTLQDGIFRKSISENIVVDFSKGNFLAVILFGVAFAFAWHERVKVSTSGIRESSLFQFFTELNGVLLMLMNGIIFLTGPAICSLIAGALGTQSSVFDIFTDLGILMATTLTGMLCHLCCCYVPLFYVITKENPWVYLLSAAKAQTFAFASASSVATLPLTMACVKDAWHCRSNRTDAEIQKAVEEDEDGGIISFVTSLGSTINMDGGAIYFPAAIVFLAISGGLDDQVNQVSSYLLVRWGMDIIWMDIIWAYYLNMYSWIFECRFVWIFEYVVIIQNAVITWIHDDNHTFRFSCSQRLVQWAPRPCPRRL